MYEAKTILNALEDVANPQAASDFIEFLKNWILNHESTGHALIGAFFALYF